MSDFPTIIIFIGCGFGNKTLSIIKAIQEYQTVTTVALDPSAILLSLFKDQLTDQTIELVCSVWEEYYPTTQFDLITSIHTFYYIDKWDVAIKKMMAHLNTNGKICIAIRSNDPVCQFRDYFYKTIHDGTKKERTCDELCELLEKLGIPYKLDKVASKLDVSDCLAQNEKGKQLIEFLLRQPFINLRDLSGEIHSYLKSAHENGYFVQEDGYVWISKQSQ